MRLLNPSFIKDQDEPLKLEEFFGSDIPPYAILSHTWGKEEVTFQDIASSTQPPYHKAGFSKIRGCCARAAQDGYEYVWIDTCCIDKTSSAELSEAINSMYKWYEEADICYAYLSDVVSAVVDFYHLHDGKLSKTFKTSKWFTRGWTLQDLIAPRTVEFYAEDWTDLGTKSSRREEISLITGIDVRVLDGEDPAICNVAERLFWAASRQTTRVEDAAYCLLGIFQVHMPLLYGEGERALIRLQEEILKTTEDYTLLARGGIRSCRGLEMTSEENHWTYSDLVISAHMTSLPSESMVADISPTLTARGLHISLPLLKVADTEYLAYLYCRDKRTDKLMCMPLTRTHPEENRFARKLGDGNGSLLPATQLTSFRLATMFIQQAPRASPGPQAYTRAPLPSTQSLVLTFEASATTGSAVSRNCTVMTSWGSSTKVLPWKTVIEEDASSFRLCSSALFVLGSGDNFMVNFGSEYSRFWRCVLNGYDFPLNIVRRDQSHEWESWSEYESFVPSVLIDRAWKKLRIDRVVNVSIRKVLSGLAVSVHINDRTHLGQPHGN